MAGDFDVALSAGKGALSGASTGSQVGSVIPGVGGAVGTGVGAAIGSISAGIKANKAGQAAGAIQAQDPQELARLAEINRIRRSIGAGTDPLTQQKLRQAQQIGASTQANIARVTGGGVGATIAGLTRSQRGTQAASNQAIAGAQQRLPFFENLGQQLRPRVAQRSLEVGLQRRDQALAERAAQGKANSANIAGAIALAGNSRGIGPSAAPVTGGGAIGSFNKLGTEPVANELPQEQFNQIPLNIGNAIVSGATPGQQQLAPPIQSGPIDLSQGSGISGVSQVFNPSQVLGVNGIPSPSVSPSVDILNNSQQAINAVGTAFSNIDNLGSTPL